MQEVRIDPAVMVALQNYDWPGNIRELKNLVKRMLVFSQDLSVDLLPPEILNAHRPAPSDVPTPALPQIAGLSFHLEFQLARDDLGVLEQLERRVLQEALTWFKGDRYAVARFLGLSPPSVYRKIKQYGIQEERRFVLEAPSSGG